MELDLNSRWKGTDAKRKYLSGENTGTAIKQRKEHPLYGVKYSGALNATILITLLSIAFTN